LFSHSFSFRSGSYNALIVLSNPAFWKAASDQKSEDFLQYPALHCSTTAWEVFLDYVDQFGTVGRLCDDAMSFDTTTISRFFRRDKRSYEDDWHAVPCPIGFNLGGDFRAVSKLRIEVVMLAWLGLTTLLVILLINLWRA